MIRTWFSAHERGKAIGLFMTSSSFAVVVTDMSVPVMTQYLGWQNSYRVLGATTIVRALHSRVLGMGECFNDQRSSRIHSGRGNRQCDFRSRSSCL
ncbi:hypothetical protein [Paraburkholderia xenovorans]|uniref:Uncharacterized protein n=1 Tax=Paraburkholderia xenovorans (strain LB400) TaxID=266265 RepID=Q13H87_PARXL|nr:hypothetical protein Bxe_C0654 [Paraburkholderia xenovorans LB400]